MSVDFKSGKNLTLLLKDLYIVITISLKLKLISIDCISLICNFCALHAVCVRNGQKSEKSNVLFSSVENFLA